MCISNTCTKMLVGLHHYNAKTPLTNPLKVTWDLLPWLRMFKFHIHGSSSRSYLVNFYWYKPEWAQHIYVIYVKFVCLSICLCVGPYVHNMITYWSSINLQNTFNCWLQLWKTYFLDCSLHQQTHCDKLNKQVIKLSMYYGFCPLCAVLCSCCDL